MFQAMITLVINSTLYFRKTVLAYVPEKGSYIEVHAATLPTLVLKVTQTRNRISAKSGGESLSPLYAFLPTYMSVPMIPGGGISVRAYPVHDDKIRLPRTDGDARPSTDMLRKMDGILQLYGFERITNVATPAVATTDVGRDLHGRVDLRVVFTKRCSVQWLAMDTKDPTAVLSDGVTGTALGDLYTIGPCDDRDDCWLITSRQISGSTPLCALVRKDSVTIPPSQSVEVTFLDSFDVNWMDSQGVLMGDLIDKGSTLRFKAVLANPLNPDQVAFVRPDNRFALLSSNCFKYIQLPAGDLTDLPSFPKKPACTVGREGPIMFHIVGGHKPDDESMVGFVDQKGRRVRVVQDLETLYAVAMQRDRDPNYMLLYSAGGESLRILSSDLVLDDVADGSDIYYMKRVTENVTWRKPGTHHHEIRMYSGQNYNASRLVKQASTATVPTYQLTGEEGRTTTLKADAFAVYQINPQKLPSDAPSLEVQAKRIPHVYGWVRFKKRCPVQTQLNDDTVNRVFDEGERVMVRTLTRDEEHEDIVDLRLVDGSLWRVYASSIERSEIPLWIQVRKTMPMRLRTGVHERTINLLAGSRILLRNMLLTPREADAPAFDRDARTFELDHATTFQMTDGEYEIGQVHLHANAVTPDGVNGLTNIFFKIGETVTKVATVRKIIDQVKIPAGEYLARLVEIDSTRVIITMPDFSYFWVPQAECKLIGGHATEDPHNNAPYRNAVVAAQR